MTVPRFILVGLLLVSGSLIAHAEPPAGYYLSAKGKTGADLRRALHQIIANHHVVPYASSTQPDTSDALQVLDEDPANTNNVILIYARRSEPKSTFGLTTGWNREHLWPNSYGLDDREPAYSDLHNLRAADATVNSARGNKFFDDSDPSDPNYRAPAQAEAPLTSTDSDSWEPPEVVKGDIARALFYMDVRYEPGTTGEPDLVLTEATGAIASTTNFMGRLRTLLVWHEADPVDAVERQRNDLVFERYQQNRNPFVDRPEFVRRVFWPVLHIERVQVGSVRLTWPGGFSNAVVQVSQNPGGSWVGLGMSPLLTNGRWMVTEATTNVSHYYRLRW